jgi:surface antigen
VLAWDGRKSGRRSLYNGTAGLRLRFRRSRRVVPATLVAVALCALAFSGCSYKLASLVSSDDGDPPQSTGTIAATPANAAAKTPTQAELDLAYARVAVSRVLSRGGTDGSDASVAWQNPQSGARGNIMPLASAYSEAGLACRDFLASYMHGESHDWLEGAACRNASGTWEVRRLKPLKPS